MILYTTAPRGCGVSPRALALAAAIVLAAPGTSRADESRTSPATPSASGAARALPSVTVTGRRVDEKLGLDSRSSTGSRLGLTPRETPASVAIVERATFEARGAYDTQEILSGVPGITAASPPGSPGSVSYRGFGASQITQLFNGITVQYDAIAARPVDSWIYDRVEVIGGPSTFLFGAGAVGGSINYVTRLATPEARGPEFRASQGSYGTTQLAFGGNAAVGGGEIARNHARVDANFSHSDGWVDGNERRAWTLAGSWLTEFSPVVTHTLAAEFQREHVDRPYWGTPVLNPATGRLHIDESTRFENYNSRDGLYQQTVVWLRSLLDLRLANGTTLRNTAYHYDALRDYRNVEVYRYLAANDRITRSSPLLQRHDQTLTGDRVEARFAGAIAGRPSAWAAGADFSVNEQTRFPLSLSGIVSTVDPRDFVTESFWSIPGIVPGFNPDRTNEVRTLALFVENRTQLGDALALVTGLRRDRIELQVTNFRTVTATSPAYFENTYEPLTGRAGLMYALRPTLNVYAQYSTAADPPAGILTTASFAQVRDFDLTTGRQFEVGAKLDFPDGRGSATLAAYDIVRRNLAVTDPANPTTTLPVGRQSSRGVELAASLRATERLLLQGNYAWVDAQYDDFFETVAGVAVSRAGRTPPNTPRQVVNAWLDYDLAVRWHLSLDARWVGKVYADNANSAWVPGYTILGAAVEFRPTAALRLSARVRNLADEVYARSVTGTPMFFLGAPRTYELSVHASL